MAASPKLTYAGLEKLRPCIDRLFKIKALLGRLKPRRRQNEL